MDGTTTRPETPRQHAARLLVALALVGGLSGALATGAAAKDGADDVGYDDHGGDDAGFDDHGGDDAGFDDHGGDFGFDDSGFWAFDPYSGTWYWIDDSGY